MIANLWKEQKVPDSITLARVVSLYKTGDPEKQENYRPISLLNTFYKIIAAALQRRLAGTLDHLLMKTQYGFRQHRSTIDALFVAKRLQEYAERTGQPGMMILPAWEKACDKISHNWLIKALESFQLPDEIIGMIKALQKATVLCRRSKVRNSNATNRNQTRMPSTTIPIHNGDGHIIRSDTSQQHKLKMRIQRNIVEGIVKTFNAILYADDTMLCRNSEKENQALPWAVEEVSEIFGLALNKKTCQTNQ